MAFRTDKGVVPLHEVKVEKYRGSRILKLAVLCFAVFIFFSLMRQQVQINDKRQQLDLIRDQLRNQQIKNEELEKSLKQDGDLADYAEKVARRDLDYAKPGERVFVDVGGSD